MNTCIRYISILSLLCFTSISTAQDYPTGPVQITVGYSPGGSGDTIARYAADALSKALGKTFIVQNRAGAAGAIGADFVAKAAPDGHTLLSGSSTELAVNNSVYAKLPYNSLRDFAPVIQYSVQPYVLVVNPSSTKAPVKSVKELIELAKSKPGVLSFGSAGNGTGQHLSTELFMMLAGVKMLHVPYKGGAPLITDLIGGRIDISISPLPEVIGHIKTGRLNALAVTSSKRSPLLPNLPTMEEAGVKGYEFTSWHGLVAPAGTPKKIIDTLNAALQKALKDDLGKRLTEAGLQVTGGTPEQAAERLRSSIVKYGELVKVSGMPLQ